MQIIAKPHSSRLSRRGTAATEFAIAVPIFLLLALATCDLGRISHHAQIVATAARTGAQNGASHQFTSFTESAWAAEVRQKVVESLGAIPQFKESDMEYELSHSLDEDLRRRVVVEINYPFRTAITWPGIPELINLHERAEFRQFR